MNKLIHCSLLTAFLLTANLCFGQHSVISSKALKQDFEIFRGALEEMHPGIYWYSSKKEMDNVFDEIKGALDKEMTSLAFYKLLARAISAVRCGHTWVALPKDTNKKLFEESPLLPIEIKLINNRMYLFKDHSQQTLSIKPGQQILEINGLSIDSLVELSEQVYSGDGWSTTGKKSIFERYFNVFYVLHVAQPEVYELKYLNEKNESKRVSIKALSAEALNIKRVEREYKNIEIKMLGSNKALLAIRAFDNWKEEGKKKRFLKELDKAFVKINAAQVKNLIIDLRDNGGGTEKFGLKLCSYFTKEAFYGYKQIRLKNKQFEYRRYSKTSGFEYFVYKALLNPKKVNDTTYLIKNDRNLKQVQAATPHFSGQVYILCNGGTYSTATDFAALMHSKGLATFIGEETGGGYRGNSSNYEFEFELSNSKVRFNVPIAQYLTDVNYTTENYGRGIIPSHQIVPTIQNLINGVDTELEYTLGLIDNR